MATYILVSILSTLVLHCALVIHDVLTHMINTYPVSLVHSIHQASLANTAKDKPPGLFDFLSGPCIGTLFYLTISAVLPG